jgi:predicted  nucleic acid-binding Zn-ribbon protein
MLCLKLVAVQYEVVSCDFCGRFMVTEFSNNSNINLTKI